MYADAGIPLCVGVGRCMCIGQRSIPYVFFNRFPHCFWRKGFLLSVELTDLSKLAGPRAPGISLSLP